MALTASLLSLLGGVIELVNFLIGGHIARRTVEVVGAFDVCLMSVKCPELRHDYLLNLSISVSRGKETNKDSRSNGE